MPLSDQESTDTLTSVESLSYPKRCYAVALGTLLLGIGDVLTNSHALAPSCHPSVRADASADFNRGGLLS